MQTGKLMLYIENMRLKVSSFNDNLNGEPTQVGWDSSASIVPSVFVNSRITD